MPKDLGWSFFGHTGIGNKIEVDGGNLIFATLSSGGKVAEGVHIYAGNNFLHTDNVVRIANGGYAVTTVAVVNGMRNLFEVSGGELLCNVVYFEWHTVSKDNVFRISDGGLVTSGGNNEVGVTLYGTGNLMDVEDGELHTSYIACNGIGETFRIGPKGHVKTSYWVDYYARGSGSLFECQGGRADFPMGYLNVGYNDLAHTDNTFRVSDGGLVNGTGVFEVWGVDGMVESIGVNPDDETPSLLDMKGTIWLGMSSLPGMVGNSLRTGGGGKIKCNDLTVASGNGLAPLVCAPSENRLADTGFIDVAGTATFLGDTYIKPKAEKGAVAGKYKILQSAQPIVYNNLKLVTPPGPEMWSLITETDSIWLRFSHPATMVIVK